LVAKVANDSLIELPERFSVSSRRCLLQGSGRTEFLRTTGIFSTDGVVKDSCDAQKPESSGFPGQELVAFIFTDSYWQ
jgi:hypothetical protein